MSQVKKRSYGARNVTIATGPPYPIKNYNKEENSDIHLEKINRKNLSRIEPIDLSYKKHWCIYYTKECILYLILFNSSILFNLIYYLYWNFMWF